MCSKLGYQLKRDCYKYEMFCVSLMVPTKQKPTADTQKMKRRGSKHTSEENYQISSISMF